MRRIKLFACLAIMTTLVLGTTVPAFSFRVEEFVEEAVNSAGPGGEEYSRREAEKFVQNYYANAAIEEQKYNAAHGISSSPAPAAPAPSQPAVVAPTPVITPNQAAQIQTAQQKALAANPTADPAAIYLQTLQANGFTIDATGKIVKLP